MAEYRPPSITQRSFNCPYCNVFAQHFWFHVWVNQDTSNEPPSHWVNTSKETPRLKLISSSIGYNTDILIQDMVIGKCHHCQQITLWIGNKLIYPDRGAAPPPNEDLSDDIRKDYEEAASICSKSPRGAAALLRLAIQKLCGELGQTNKNLNDAIGELVKQGLLPKVQKAMDYVRVTGNEAVHPGQVDLRDNPEIVGKLFDLVNGVAQEMITRPRMLEETFESLPKSKKDQIKRRDKKQGN